MSNMDPINHIRAYSLLDTKGVEARSGKADDVLMEGRLSKLEGMFSMVGASIALLATVTVASAVFLTGRMDRLETKIDAIPAKLTDEFRAMRAEMSAQTSAIANSVTAARGAPTQVILIPAPPIAPSQK